MATTLASSACILAFSTECGTPLAFNSPESRSDFSTDVVPTSTG
jgi:hypothetical protein